MRVSNIESKESIKLPNIKIFNEMIIKLQNKHQYKINNPKAAKRGRKRHGLLCKKLWSKTFPRNVYEPRIVHKFHFRKPNPQLQKSI